MYSLFRRRAIMVLGLLFLPRSSNHLRTGTLAPYTQVLLLLGPKLQCVYPIILYPFPPGAAALLLMQGRLSPQQQRAVRVGCNSARFCTWSVSATSQTISRRPSESIAAKRVRHNTPGWCVALQPRRYPLKLGAAPNNLGTCLACEPDHGRLFPIPR